MTHTQPKTREFTRQRPKASVCSKVFSSARSTAAYCFSLWLWLKLREPLHHPSTTPPQKKEEMCPPPKKGKHMWCSFRFPLKPSKANLKSHQPNREKKSNISTEKACAQMPAAGRPRQTAEANQSEPFQLSNGLRVPGHHKNEGSHYQSLVLHRVSGINRKGSPEPREPLEGGL